MRLAEAAAEEREVIGTPVEEIAGCVGAGRLWLSTRPLGAAMATSPDAGREADALENGLSPKREMSVLQPAALAAMMARTATRADRRARDTARERMM
jgi:hypothetical protein